MSQLRLYFKNEAFETVGVMEHGAEGLNYSSLEWESIFHKPDKFAMQCGVTDAAQVEYLMDKSTVYVIRSDTQQLGYIQKKEFDGSRLTLDGIGAEGLLEKRFTIEKDYVPQADEQGMNQVGVVMCDIINDNLPYAWLLAERELNRTGPSIATYTELTGNVLKYVKMLSSSYDVGYKCVYDEAANKARFVTFDVVGFGVDIPGRSYIFSDDIDNVKSIQYSIDTSKYYNYVRVIGDGLTRIVDQSAGGERYEYSCKSNSRKKELSNEEYGEILHNDGLQELAKRKLNEVFLVEPKEDQYVELGWEAVSLSKNINKSTTSFCTEVRETWETTYKREYTFGYRADAKDSLIISLQGEF